MIKFPYLADTSSFLRKALSTVRVFRLGPVRSRLHVSYCPEIGVSSCGDMPEEALHNSKEAVELCLENAQKLGIN